MLAHRNIGTAHVTSMALLFFLETKTVLVADHLLKQA